MNARDILKKPYSRLVIPDDQNGYFAEIVEFPGCFAVGETAGEAIRELDAVALDWISAAQSQGQKIPDPLGSIDYSGRLVVRMPKGLHQRAAFMAQREGVSLNQFIVTCISEQVGMKAAPASGVTLIHLGSGFAANSANSSFAQYFMPLSADIQNAPFLPQQLFNIPGALVLNAQYKNKQGLENA